LIKYLLPLLIAINITPYNAHKKNLSIFSFERCNSRERAEDTLLLDDGTEIVCPGNPYIAQKFTPGVPCTLKSILVRSAMSGMPCSLFVWNDTSGFPQSSINLISPIFYSSSYPDWQRIDLPLPIELNDEFWIGLHSTSAIYSDFTVNCSNRVAHSNDKKEWNVLSYHYHGEYLLRAIVSLVGTRHDVSCSRIFSKKGFFLPNPSNDTVGIIIRNYGNETENDVPVYLRVTDSLGMVVFFDVLYRDSIQSGKTDTVFLQWNYDKDGDFTIEGYPWVNNDCMPDNDRQKIESYIRTYPCELYYDNAQTLLSTTLLDSISNKFIPPYYPCKIDSIKFLYAAWALGSTFTYGIGATILNEDSLGFPGSEVAKESIVGLSPVFIGTLAVDFSQQNVIIDSGGFYAEWACIPDSTTPPDRVQLYTDIENPPFSMMCWYFDQGAWYHSYEHFEAIIRACVDFPNAVNEEEKKPILSNYLSVNPTITKGKFKCSFSTEKDGMIDITLFSLDGRKAKTLLKTSVKKGLHHFYADISNLPQGIYFICMKGNCIIEKKKLILIN
jgi:hypothetical protein